MQKKEEKLTYPRKWEFMVVGRDKEKIENAIKEVLKDKEHSFEFSKVSKNKKFNSYKARCEVKNQEERDKFYKDFNDHQDIDFVL